MDCYCTHYTCPKKEIIYTFYKFHYILVLDYLLLNSFFYASIGDSGGASPLLLFLFIFLYLLKQEKIYKISIDKDKITKVSIERDKMGRIGKFGKNIAQKSIKYP